MVRDCGKTRRGHEIGGPSRFTIRVAFDDWHCAASNPQGGLVLGPSLIVMERGLIPILNHGIVTELFENEQPDPEQVDPEDFEALFEHVSGNLVLPVRLSHG